MILTLTAAAWLGCGVIGGHMLSYPGDGFNARYVFGAICGPLALLVALLELAIPD